MSHKLQRKTFLHTSVNHSCFPCWAFETSKCTSSCPTAKNWDSSCFIPFGIVSIGPKKMLVLLFLDRDRESDVFYSLDLTEYWIVITVFSWPLPYLTLPLTCMHACNWWRELDEIASSYFISQMIRPSKKCANHMKTEDKGDKEESNHTPPRLDRCAAYLWMTGRQQDCV